MHENMNEFVATVLETPLHQHFGLRLIDPARPEAGIELTVEDHLLNVVGVLHGGVFPACLDVAAYLAVLPRLAPGTHATTVSASTAIARGAAKGDVVQFVGAVTKTGRTLAFTSAEALRNGETIATCELVKAIVPGPEPSAQA